MAVSPLNTIPLLPSFRGSVDFCNFVHRGGSGNRASNPVKMLTAARATCPSLARKTVPPNCPKPVTTPGLEATPSPGKQISRRRERKSRRRGPDHAKLPGYSASSSRRCLMKQASFPSRMRRESYITIRTEYNPIPNCLRKAHAFSTAWAGVPSLPGRPGIRSARRRRCQAHANDSGEAQCGRSSRRPCPFHRHRVGPPRPTPLLTA